MEFYFEKLDVQQNARVFVKDIYLVTVDFPNDEKYGIVSQVRRASSSITANVAEGMSRISEKEKARFIGIAFSSAMEVINFLILSKDLEMIKEEDYNDLRGKLEKITNQLNSLHNRLTQGR